MNGTKNIYRPATREELELAVEWAAREGWNPGLHDADIFWETDPAGYVCIERPGEGVIATGSIVSYGEFGFMGFFIVREGLRGQGIGAPFWHWRKERLWARLSGSRRCIGMDGVFAMQGFYSRGGFTFSHRNLRMEGRGQSATPAPHLVLLSSLPWARVAAYDLRMFGFPRENFLRPWTTPREGLALGSVGPDGGLLGYGVLRKCRVGYKIGPLFADDPAIAENLFQALSNRAAGEALFLDVPEISPPAMALAQRHGMQEMFGCARMYAGPAPALPWQDGVYGVTSFELG